MSTTTSRHIRKWRHQAEECRMLAECAGDDGARETYEALADSYDQLTEHSTETTGGAKRTRISWLALHKVALAAAFRRPS